MFGPGRAPFFPQVFRWAAHLEQLPVQGFLSDPTKIANALHRAWQQLGYDGLFPYLDATLEAEALGCSVEWRGGGEQLEVTGPPHGQVKPEEILSTGRVPVALEVTRRLRIMVPPPTCLVAAFPTAAWLGRALAGGGQGLPSTTGAALKAITALVRALAEIGVDLVWVRGLSADDPEFAEELRRLVRVTNLARFYNRRAVVSVGASATDAHLAQVAAAGFAGVVLDADGEWQEAARQAVRRDLLVGLALPRSLIVGDETGAQEVRRELLHECPGGAFLTTAEEVQDMPPEAFSRLVRALTDGW